jgi:predicted secreted protein
VSSNARDLIVKIRTATGPDVFTTLGALVDVTGTLTDTEDDVSTKASNYRAMHTTGTMKSLDVSGNLVVDDSTVFEFLVSAKESVNPSVVAQLITPKSTYEGTFAIGDLPFSGGNSGAQRSSLSLKSAGAITITATA